VPNPYGEPRAIRTIVKATTADLEFAFLSSDSGVHIVNAQPLRLNLRAFRTGDRVLLNGKLGTITDIFPDGIHMVKLDETGKVLAATAAQLQLAPEQCDVFTRRLSA
jgi:hypothetical protein